MRRRFCLPPTLLTAALAAACESDDARPAAEPSDPLVVPLSSMARLVRISMAVRGQRPSAEAPLRLIEHVVRNDRPLTEIVTSDDVLADAHVAAV